MSYRDRYHLQPLGVRAYLRTPVVSDSFLPLDGLLLYQAHRDIEEAQMMTTPGAYTSQAVSTLPLGILHPGKRQWYYQCSWAQWGRNTEGQDHWNKRFDNSLASLIDFQGKSGRILIDKGEYKAYRTPIYYRAALYVEWYCIGDQREIAYLLSTMTHVGKKGAQGWGRVYRWEIAPVADDYSVWYGDRLMRGVPPEEAPRYQTGVYGIRPSYWNKGNQMLLALPERT
jgi:CRISPR type IV-associated protein Csf3